jgi:hypothetical protein
MKRKIPNINSELLFFIKNKDDNYIEEYEKIMVNTEISIEKRLISIFENLGISASVKTDRYSLPFNNQIKITQYSESYLNAAFNTDKLFREIFKKILNQDLEKIRFFIFLEIVDAKDTEDGIMFWRNSAVNLYFNYHFKEVK